MSDPAVALRAKQLCSRAERRAVATSLASMLEAADTRRGDTGSRPILDHASVLSLRDEIVALIALLRSATVCDVRGIALARLLSCDSSSPLFRASAQTLRQALAEISDAV